MVVQDVLPVLLDLSLRAMPGSTKQGRDFPFSQRYMQHVAGDVQHTLCLTGMNTAAQLMQTLLGSSVFCSQHANEQSRDSRELNLQADAAVSKKLHDIFHSDQASTVTSALCTLSHIADGVRSFFLPCVTQSTPHNWTLLRKPESMLTCLWQLTRCNPACTD